jgi:hypothetical protein
MLYLSRDFPDYRLSPNAATWEGQAFPNREAVDSWLKENGYEFSCRLNASIEVWDKK